MNVSCNKDNFDNREVISLFSGAMGLNIGLMKAGLHIAIGQDFDSTCIATMNANGHNSIKGDIRNIEPMDILNKTGMKPGEPFLICGGPPCQPFSTAGKRLGIHDPRGTLFMDFIRMINVIRPRFIIMENVKGITNIKCNEINKDNDEWTVLDIVLSEFRNIGYHTVHGVLDAVNYGVPQFRERLIIVGSRDGESIFLPCPTHFQMHQNRAHRWQTLYDAIFDLEQDCGECATFSKKYLDILSYIPQGGNWRNLPDSLKKLAMGGAYSFSGGKVGFYRRLSYKQPSPTLVTSPTQKATMLCHPTQNHPLSIREYARIQQFPDSWIFTGSTISKYRQIGNAVPIGLGEALGNMLLSVANNSAWIQTKRFRTNAFVI